MIMAFMLRFVCLFLSLLPCLSSLKTLDLGTNADTDPFIARSIKLLYTLPPIPSPCPIFFLAGFDNPDDHLSAEGAEGMAKSRRRGSSRLLLTLSLPYRCLPFFYSFI